MQRLMYLYFWVQSAAAALSVQAVLQLLRAWSSTPSALPAAQYGHT